MVSLSWRENEVSVAIQFRRYAGTTLPRSWRLVMSGGSKVIISDNIITPHLNPLPSGEEEWQWRRLSLPRYRFGDATCFVMMGGYISLASSTSITGTPSRMG